MRRGAVATVKNSPLSATKNGVLRMKIAFAGPIAVRFADPVKAQLAVPCEVIAEDDEARIMLRLADIDVLVSMGFTKRWPRLVVIFD
jgi:hypothetical protein